MLKVILVFLATSAPLWADTKPPVQLVVAQIPLAHDRFAEDVRKSVEASPRIERCETVGENYLDQLPEDMISQVLSNYDAVLVWGTRAKREASKKLMRVLAGLKRGLVFSGRAPFRYSHFDWMPLRCFLWWGTKERLSMGRRNDLTHPVLEGVKSFTGSLSKRTIRSEACDLHPKAKPIALYEDGRYLAAYRDDLDRRIVSLTFPTPSSRVRPYYWDAGTDGGKILSNALYYVSAQWRPEPFVPYGPVAPPQYDQNF